jgi:hypothetical protein
MSFKLLQFLMFAVEVRFLLLLGNIEPFIVFCVKLGRERNSKRKFNFLTENVDCILHQKIT